MKQNNDKYLVSVDLADTGTDYTAENIFQMSEDGIITLVRTKSSPRMTEQETNKQFKCIGAIIGDIAGQRFVTSPVKHKAIKILGIKSHFTDDTVMTCAIMDWLVNGNDLSKTLKEWGLKYIDVGYSKKMEYWIRHGTFGQYLLGYDNGCAMRVSPVGWVAQSIEECVEMARESSIVSHNNIKDINGALAVASSVFLSRIGKTKEEIKDYVSSNFNYNIDKLLNDNKWKGFYYYYASCQKSVPEAITSFIEAVSFDDCIKNAISLGGDANTQANIAAAIGEAYGYQIDNKIYQRVFYEMLTEDMQNIITDFNKKFISK